MRKKIIIAIAILAFSHQAGARPMITDVSDRFIKINAKFSGKEILLYGARVEAGNIVVVIRGPSDDYIVRKKEMIGGIWVNTSSVEFNDVPEYYRVSSSAKLPKLESDILLGKLGIGTDTIKFEGRKASVTTRVPEFAQALKDRMVKEGMFNFEVINLPFLEGTLFRTHINFPAKISDGIYTAEIYSFNEGQLLGMQSIPIEARKAGVEAVIYDNAHQHPALYGLFSIAMAIIIGVCAGRFFKKL